MNALEVLTQRGDLNTIGSGLDRPESVLAARDGSFFTSYRGHGVCHISADGRQTLLADETWAGGEKLCPNGIARLPDGSFLLANIADSGGIYRVADGRCAPYVTRLGDKSMPPVNFVTTDSRGRVWFSISSHMSPRHLAYRRTVRDGCIGIIEDGVARILIEGLHYTNEIRPDLDAGRLYVSETFAQTVSVFPLNRDLTFGSKQTFANFPTGCFVDGIALDSEGGLVAACIVANEVYHVSSSGTLECLLSERDDAWVSTVETALDNGTMDRSHFDTTPSKTLRNVSSVAFHGANLDRLVCGSLLGDRLIDLPAPVRGRSFGA